MKNCILCSTSFQPKSKQKYCLTCKNNGAARKDILKKYNSSEKNKKNQKRWYYSDIKKTRVIKNRFNRSEKGIISKNKYYTKNKEKIIKKNLIYYKKEMNSRAKARRIYKKVNKSIICSTCRTTLKIHIHHKDKNVFNNDIKNLIALCSSCHGKEHVRLNLVSFQNKQ